LSAEAAVAISILSLIVSILNVIYTRRRSIFMGRQLKLMEEDKQEKSTYRTASEIVQKTTTEILRSVEEMNNTIHYHADMDGLRDDIIRKLYDEKKENLELNFDPLRLTFRTVESGQVHSYSKLDTFTDFQRKVEEAYENKYRPVVWLYYQCAPEVRRNPQSSIIDLSRFFELLGNIYQARKELIQFERQISTFNNRVLNEMETAIADTVKRIYDGIMRSRTIKINQNSKSPEIGDLLRGVIDAKTIKEHADLINEQNQRLASVQRELFEASK